MVMEAMRLSLLEHEAQQRRQKEEEEKRQKEEAEAAAASAASDASDTQDRPSEDRPGQSQTGAPSTVTQITSSEPTPQLQPVGDGDSISRSRTSTSSHARTSSTSPSGHLTPPSDPVGGGSHRGRRSGRSTPTSQYGAISAAVLSATSTASAVASPSPEREPSDPLAETEATVAGPASASTVEEVAAAQIPPPVVLAGEPEVSDSSSNDPAVERPALEHPPSFASSAAPSSYDVLPSSPESTGDKPLLRPGVSPTPATGDEPGAPATN